MPRPPSLLALLSLVVLVGLLFPFRPSLAQEPRDDAMPGDFFWRLARNGLLSDARIEDALVLLVDSETVTAAAEVEGALFYGDPRVREFTGQAGSQDVPLLLAAAGFANPSKDLVSTRICRYWTPQNVAASADLIAIGRALGADLSRVLGGLGVDAAPCEFTADSEQADVFIWSFGQNIEFGPGYDVSADSFLAATFDAPGRVPGGTVGEVTPPVTGSAGLLPVVTPAE